MKFQLDTKAMEALFPEGSEARVELQRAVIANFAKRIKDQHVSDLVRQEVYKETHGIAEPRELARLMNEALKREFDKIGQWGAHTNLNEHSDIAQAMRSYVGRLQYELMADLRKEHETLMKSTLESRVSALVEQAQEELAKVETELTTRVRANISRQMNDIIKQELKKALS